MISEKRAIKYCKEDISLIENYDKAVSDTTQMWHCHHRRETIYSVKELIDIGEYYNRPACELIFLTPFDHRRLHKHGKHLSEETRKKMSAARKGKNHSVEARKKMSAAHKGKHHSEETRKKIAEALKGENHPLFGKHPSAEARKKMSEARKGKHWYNNGDTSVQAKACPEGFVPGRIK